MTHRILINATDKPLELDSGQIIGPGQSYAVPVWSKDESTEESTEKPKKDKEESGDK